MCDDATILSASLSGILPLAQFTINIYLGTDIATEAVVLLVCLGVSSLCLLATHYKVANLDTGKLRSEVGMYDDLGR